MAKRGPSAISHSSTDALSQKINDYTVLCIVGEAGSGKSTMVPQLILESSLVSEGMTPWPCSIVVAQPRCVGAVGLARRVSAQRGEQCGQTVGFCAGSQRSISRQTCITYCTYSYLLKSLTHSPLQTRRYTHIILDEIHERTIDADLVLLLVRKFVHELSPDTKILLMSTTMQGSLFVDYFREVFGVNRVSDSIFLGLKRYHVDEYCIDELHNLANKYSNEDMCQLKRQSAQSLGCLISTLSDIQMFSDPYSQPSVISFTQEICMELIILCCKGGESILVFLPGISEILDYYEILTMEFQRRGLKESIQLFILHSQVSVEEQSLALKVPPQDQSHVILSTNIAESSLTIPMLRLVVNFGIDKVPKYDHHQKMTCLLNMWCSRAACTQRAGRVGRVIEGTAVHLFPRSMYENVLTDYNPPEMHTMPLGKLVLRARQLVKNLGIEKPSELLKLTIEPPSLLQIESTLQELAEIGALLADSDCTSTETAEITVLGRFSLLLPLDLDLCRLVFFSLCFGCPVEGIVMAMAVSLNQDLFSMPSRFLKKSQEEYKDALLNSIMLRFRFDGERFSDNLMACSLFKEWVEFCRDESFSLSTAANLFSKSNALDYTRFHLFLTTIASTAAQVLSFLPTESPSYCQVHSLSLLTQAEIGCVLSDLTFCENESLLHALLVASFVSNVVIGKRKIQSDMSHERKTACLAQDIIAYSKFKPASCIAMTHTKKSEEKSIQTAVSEILTGSKLRLATGLHITVVEVTEPRPFLFVDESLALLWQFGERRSQWHVDICPNIAFSSPFSPFEIIWNRLTGGTGRVYVSSWRNRTAFVLSTEKSPPPFLGVFTYVQGGESAMFECGRGLTFLPSLTDSKLALFYLLAFQPFHVAIQLRADKKHVTALHINEFEIDFESWQVLTSDELRLINSLRHVLSELLNCTEQDNNRLLSQQILAIQSKVSLLIGGTNLSQPQSVQELNVSNTGQFYPPLKCSLLGENSGINPSMNKSYPPDFTPPRSPGFLPPCLPEFPRTCLPSFSLPFSPGFLPPYQPGFPCTCLPSFSLPFPPGFLPPYQPGFPPPCPPEYSNIPHQLIEKKILNILVKNNGQIKYRQLLRDQELKQLMSVLRFTLSPKFFTSRPDLFTTEFTEKNGPSHDILIKST